MEQHPGLDDGSLHSEYQNEDENDNKSPDNQPIHKLNTHNFTSVETLHVPQANIHEAKSSETLNVAHADTSIPPKKTAEWSMTPQVIRNAERDEAAGFKKRELGVTWQSLTVDVLAAEAAVNENMISQFNLPQLIKDFRRKPPLK